MECLDDDRLQVKELSFSLLNELILKYPDLVDPLVENLINCVIEHYNDEGQLTKTADQVLYAIAQTQDQVKVL